MSKTDPRANARPLSDVPALVAEGARLWNGARWWHAHEAWEEAWHALRAAGRDAEAEFLRGLILATAATENLARGKPDGFRRQMAEALHRLRAHAGAGAALGVADERAFVEGLLGFYLDAARRTGLADLASLGARPPTLRLEGEEEDGG